MKTNNVLTTLVFSLLTFIALPILAQDTTAEKSPWAHESELAVVTVDGNTESESYSGKQKTSYTWDKNSLVAAGRYLETTSNGVDTAKLWEASARYERAISDIWSAYLGHGAESDRFNGFIQRDNSDIGAKYQILKNDLQTWVAEAGYRYTHIYSTDRTHTYVNSTRLYTQYNHKINESLSFGYWLEYLPSFNEPDYYFVNTEPSLNVMLNSVFSLKTAYLLKYQNQLPAGNDKYVDTTFTTALVAKF